MAEQWIGFIVNSYRTNIFKDFRKYLSALYQECARNLIKYNFKRSYPIEPYKEI